LAPAMLESQSRALKTDHSPVKKKKLEPKMACWVGAQGQINLA